MPVYVLREQNVIQKILKEHFSDFEERYNDIYAKQYGKYRIICIKEAVEEFLECGDYLKGIARIKCANPHCGHEYFRPFSCKSWYLYPSCNQKRLLLFSEYLSENVLLKLPHRQFDFALPKLLQVYFKNELQTSHFFLLLTGCSIAGSIVTRKLLFFGEKRFREYYVGKSAAFFRILTNL